MRPFESFLLRLFSPPAAPSSSQSIDDGHPPVGPATRMKNRTNDLSRDGDSKLMIRRRVTKVNQDRVRRRGSSTPDRDPINPKSEEVLIIRLKKKSHPQELGIDEEGQEGEEENSTTAHHIKSIDGHRPSQLIQDLLHLPRPTPRPSKSSSISERRRRGSRDEDEDQPIRRESHHKTFLMMLGLNSRTQLDRNQVAVHEQLPLRTHHLIKIKNHHQPQVSLHPTVSTTSTDPPAVTTATTTTTITTTSQSSSTESQTTTATTAAGSNIIRSSSISRSRSPSSFLPRAISSSFLFNKLKSSPSSSTATHDQPILISPSNLSSHHPEYSHYLKKCLNPKPFLPTAPPSNQTSSSGGHQNLSSLHRSLTRSIVMKSKSLTSSMLTLKAGKNHRCPKSQRAQAPERHHPKTMVDDGDQLMSQNPNEGEMVISRLRKNLSSLEPDHDHPAEYPDDLYPTSSIEEFRGDDEEEEEEEEQEDEGGLSGDEDERRIARHDLDTAVTTDESIIVDALHNSHLEWTTTMMDDEDLEEEEIVIDSILISSDPDGDHYLHDENSQSKGLSSPHTLLPLPSQPTTSILPLSRPSSTRLIAPSSAAKSQPTTTTLVDCELDRSPDRSMLNFNHPRQCQSGRSAKADRC